mmetsp:Transcript_60572/g.124674  ORF Transcript_60572/g.124674 Transcript_60572/m.124674 type:complete len:89 (+) Transcript_60572:179-445(+)
MLASGVGAKQAVGGEDGCRAGPFLSLVLRGPGVLGQCKALAQLNRSDTKLDSDAAGSARPFHIATSETIILVMRGLVLGSARPFHIST